MWRLAVKGESFEAVLGKRILVVSWLVTLGPLLRGAATYPTGIRIGASVFAAYLLLCLVLLLKEKRIRPLLTEVSLYMITFALLAADLRRSAEFRTSLWGFTIIFTNITFLIRQPRRVGVLIPAFCSCYLIVVLFEVMYRFGLYTLPIMVGTEKIRRERTDCPDPPCAKAGFEPIADTVSQIVFLLLNFYLIRTFANGVYNEHTKMSVAISATEEIASSLSRFDLPAAEAVLNASHLPDDLDTAFRNILENLEMYRPYLPDALFVHEEQRHRREMAAPGLSTGEVALAFTDIQGSTATWEACPDGMRKALCVHDKIIRSLTTEHDGYEVKTIGDSFMVAFEEAAQALLFGLTVQEALVEAEWPAELMMLKHCARIGEGPWCGLRVRVGVHCGAVSVQLNELTGRHDYFGETVNKASRLEGACVGGAVAVTHEVLCAVEGSGALDGTWVVEMGSVELKGLSPTDVYLLLPGKLMGRRGFVEEQMMLRREDRFKGPTKARTNSGAKRERRLSLMGKVSESPRVLQLSECPSVSVGVVEAVLAEGASVMTEQLNGALTQIATGAERTRGAVVSLQGSRAVVCWNGPCPCPLHVENSLVFVRALYGRESRHLHIGLSTGAAVCGTVGGNRLRFVAVLGGCAVEASSLCSVAVATGVACQYAASTPLPCLSSYGLLASANGGHTAPDGSTHDLFLITLPDSVVLSDQVSAINGAEKPLFKAASFHRMG